VISFPFLRSEPRVIIVPATPPPPLRTVAVILAGGTGQRVGLPIPKQFVKIAGKTIIEHTLDTFQASDDVDEIIVLMVPGYVEQTRQIVDRAGYTKVTRVLEGGSTRNETTCRALDAAGAEECNVLFHDAVRPLVSHRILADCVASLRSHQAVDVVIPSADTIIVATDGVLSAVPDRATLRRGQTPQGFRLSVIRRAYEIALQDPQFTATDDCSVVLRYLPEVKIGLVAGDEHNMKVTEPVDIFIADKLFQLASRTAPQQRTIDAYTAALEGKTVVVFGGSYGIGADVVEFAREHGADVLSFSRSSTGTHVEEPTQVAAALAEAHAQTGRIDFVVNTAGVLRPGKLADADHELVEQALRVNYLAPIHIARAAFPYLAESKGQLLLYTSSSYTRGRADYSLYSSAKAAVVNLTQALAEEWAPYDVRINCINPERTNTPMRTNAFGAEPAGTLLSSQDVARSSVDVLISDMTGHVVDVRKDAPKVPATAVKTC
jgi:2-C-methyl-D-erythritol 4-phosphate cytidylyltransferase